MGFDRSKFKGTSLATLREQQAQQDAVRPSNGGDRSYLKIEAGDNRFRILPFHPDGGGSSYAEAKTTSFMSVMAQKRDENGKPIEGEKELKRKPVFHAKVHGGYPFDLVDSYLDVAKKVAIPNLIGDDEKRYKTIWNKLTGRDGIKPNDVWAVYAMKALGKNEDGETVWGPIGILELKKTMKSQLQELASQFQSSGVQLPDPYSDPEDGIAIIINKSGKDLDTEYKISLDSVTVKENGKFSTQYVPSPLTDEQLQALEKLDPLFKMYRNVFKRSDLEMQIDGLSRLDAKLKEEGYNINVFGYDDFVNIVNQMIDLVPEEEKEQEEEKPVKKSAEKPVAQKPALKFKPKPAPVAVVVETEEEEGEEHEEEVKEEIAPPTKKHSFGDRLKKATTEEPKEAPHIVSTNSRLNDILNKVKKR